MGVNDVQCGFTILFLKRFSSCSAALSFFLFWDTAFTSASAIAIAIAITPVCFLRKLNCNQKHRGEREKQPSGNKMQSFQSPLPYQEDIHCSSVFFLWFSDDESQRKKTCFLDVEELEQSAAFPSFHPDDAVDLSSSSISILKSSNLPFVSVDQPCCTLNTNIGSSNVARKLMSSKGRKAEKTTATVSFGNGIFENWGESTMADNSQQTDTSTDLDIDDRNQCNGVLGGFSDQSKEKAGDQKTLRRLAQNREAARKSRMRKKAYVQQLESSRIRLTQLEQELHQAREQAIIVGDHASSRIGNGALAFDSEYARWLEEHQRLIDDLKSAVNSRMSDNELCFLVDGLMSHYDKLFVLKSIGTKADVFHILSGMWKTPAERCLMWLGGLRSSELLKIIGSHLEPLTDQQLMGICNLQQSSQQAEEALSQGMEALQQSLMDTLSSISLASSTSSENVANYMAQMAIAMAKLATLENFLHQADLLRQQTLQQMHRILSTRQAAIALIFASDYVSRLRALSSLWLARRRE